MKAEEKQKATVFKMGIAQEAKGELLVKIIKAEKNKWYYLLRGKVRIAKGVLGKVGERKSWVMRNYRTLLRTIPFEDCEIYLKGEEE